MITLDSPDQVIKALGGHPYARFSTSAAAGVGGLADSDGSGSGAVLWWGDAHFGRLAHAFGPRPAIDRLIEAARGRLGDVRWINVPRPRGAADAEGAWDFLWTTRIPVLSGGPAAVPVDDVDALNGLLDAGFPDSAVRPGDPIVVSWIGIWLQGRLVACAADRSARPPGSTAAPAVGMIGGVAVHPEFRGRGLGKAVTAALTARLVRAHGLSCLGVMPGNPGAAAMYESLGYHDRLALMWIHP